LTGPNSCFEDFSVGEIIVHANGRTITDEHLPLTYAVGNTHPLHFDRVFSSGLSGKMSGDPIVYGGLVFAWLEGLASRDVSDNSVWELGSPRAITRSRRLPAIPSRRCRASWRPKTLRANWAPLRHRHFPAHRRQERQRRQRFGEAWRGPVHQGERQEGPGQGKDRREDF
jgi:hypothetical protein